VAKNQSSECQNCGGTGWSTQLAGAQECKCRRERIRQVLLKRVAPHDRWARLETIQPTASLSLARATQQRLIDNLRSNPGGSYAFFGPCGIGKTSFMAALFQAAVESQTRGLYYVQMKQFLHDLRRLECGEDLLPTVSAGTIEEAFSAGVRPRVFIDEFDKVTASEFARNTVHELIDRLYGLSGAHSQAVQLVIATNLERTLFAQVWGEPILRRIETLCDVVDFFEAMRKCAA
jgi:DNA replication protein DnaC